MKKVRNIKKITHHGNNARIDPQKDITPQYTTYVVNDNKNDYSGRVGGEKTPVVNLEEFDAGFCRDAVNANKK